MIMIAKLIFQISREWTEIKTDERERQIFIVSLINVLSYTVLAFLFTINYR